MPTFERMGVIARGIFEVLSDEPQGLPLAELRERVRKVVPPAAEEQRPGNNYLGGWTTGLTKAEWLLKEDGLWKLTPEGRTAYLRFLEEDPGTFARAWIRLYHQAMADRSGAAPSLRSGQPTAPTRVAQPTRRRVYQQPFRLHPDRERRLASAVAVARLALGAPELVDEHRRFLLNQAIWFTTEVDGKYSTRYRSGGTRELAADKWRRQLRHDHVITRKELVTAMLAEPGRVAEILGSAVACVVTTEEHHRLNALGDGYRGWDRYLAAHVDVYDEKTGVAFLRGGRLCGEPSDPDVLGEAASHSTDRLEPH